MISLPLCPASPQCRTWVPPASCRRGSGWTRESSGWSAAPARRRCADGALCFAGVPGACPCQHAVGYSPAAVLGMLRRQATLSTTQHDPYSAHPPRSPCRRRAACTICTPLTSARGEAAHEPPASQAASAAHCCCPQAGASAACLVRGGGRRTTAGLLVNPCSPTLAVQHHSLLT